MHLKKVLATVASLNQSADGNWTATGTINGQTVTYNITPSQVSSN